MTEDRLIDIEIKLSRQEDLLDTLNETVYRQQKKITELEGLCAALARHLQTSGDASGESRPAHEPPPHY
ncbi:SlyX family protein [Actimicrobium antarcticum]|uniref:SlyX protein n=1 Tax=Actimicrobium antarcticum TaxID=1051899 RepID=A0ABP7TBV2_9BURK